MSDVWIVRVSNPQQLMMRRLRIWNTIAEIEGVEALDDAECISLETLQEWLLPPEQSLVKPRKTR